MAAVKASKQQIEQLERDHKNLLASLIQAGLLRIAIFKKFGIASPEFNKLNADYVPLAKNWIARQLKYEEAGAQKLGIDLATFSTEAGIEKARHLLKSIDVKGQGIGFIPILIWAVTAIVGFFTAEEIVDELNTTAEEQTALIKNTQDFCTQYNLPVEECKKIIAQQTSEREGEGGIFAGLGKGALWIGLAFLAITVGPKLLNKQTA